MRWLTCLGLKGIVLAISFWTILVAVCILCAFLFASILPLALLWWGFRLFFCLPVPAAHLWVLTPANADSLEKKSIEEMGIPCIIHRTTLPGPPLSAGGLPGEVWHLNALVAGMDNSGPPKPDLLLLHGTGSSALSILRAMQPLAKHFRLVAVDVPGMRVVS